MTRKRRPRPARVLAVACGLALVTAPAAFAGEARSSPAVSRSDATAVRVIRGTQVADVSPRADGPGGHRPEVRSEVEEGVRVDRPETGSFLRQSTRLEAAAAADGQPAAGNTRVAVQVFVVERPGRDSEALERFYERYPADVVRTLLPMPGLVPVPVPPHR